MGLSFYCITKNKVTNILVRGYTTTKQLPSVVAGTNPEQDTVRELLQQRQALLLELKHYENNSKFNDDVSTPRIDEEMGVIPANTRLQIGIATNEENKAIAVSRMVVSGVLKNFIYLITKGYSYVSNPLLLFTV